MIGIYIFKNKINGKQYVGQSVDIERRYKEHIRRNEQVIEEAIKKYGLENFEFEILEECSPEELDSREKFWIQEKKTLIPDGYNITLDGRGGLYGENNPNSKLTNEDIIFIRTCYREKIYPVGVYLWEKHFKEKVSRDHLVSIFYGKKWKTIMMEVYTQDLKEYYENQLLSYSGIYRDQRGEKNLMVVLTERDVIQIRIDYQTLERYDLFKKYSNYTERAIVSIISGQNWKHLPIYQKRKKNWLFPKEWSEEEIIEFKTLFLNTEEEKYESE